MTSSNDAAGNEADEGALGQAIAEPRDGEARRRLGREAASVERGDQGRDAAPLEGATEAPPVPVPAIAEHDDGRVAGCSARMDRQAKERDSTASSMCPPSKLSPVLSDVTVTIAGLNNMRSIA